MEQIIIPQAWGWIVHEKRSSEVVTLKKSSGWTQECIYEVTP